MERQTVPYRCHSKFTHTKINVVSGRVFLNTFRARPQGEVRARQVSGTANEFYARAFFKRWRKALEAVETEA